MSTNLYNDKITLHFDEEKHLYTVGGKVVDGTTGVLSVIAKPALIGWAVKVAIESLERTLEPGISYDELQLKAMLESAKGAHRKRSGTAADMGHMVHEWIAKHIAGENPKPLVNKECLNAVNKFLEWEREHKVEFLESEKVLYSSKYNYAGTMDFLAKVDGKVMIGDFKTSSGIWDEYWLQVAAYQQAYQEEFPEVKIDGALIVRIGKDATLEVKERAEGAYELDRDAFNAALVLYRRLRQLKDMKFMN